MIFFLLALVPLTWAGYSLVTGKGRYKGCPPGGYDRSENPFNFWAPTITLLVIGIFLLLLSFGAIRFPSR